MSDKKKIIFDWWANSGSSYAYSSEYQSVLTWAQNNSATAPSTDIQKRQEDKFVRALVYDGIWALADQIFLLSTKGGDTFSLVNIKNPGTLNGSKVASPTFTAGAGWSSAGSLSDYIRTNFIPATHGSNLTQNDAGVIVYTPTSEAVSGTKVEFGGNEATLSNAIVVSLFLSGSGVVNVRINGSGGGSSSSFSPSAGIYVLNRTSSTNINVHKDGISVGPVTTSATSGRTTRELYVLVYNNNGTPAGGTTKTIGLWILGGAFRDSSQANRMEFNIASRYDDYSSTPEAITSPSCADTTSISSYLSCLSSLSGTFSGTPSVSQILLKGTLLTGSNKWQGSALAANGYIYCAPSTSQTVLKIDTATDTYSTFGTVTATLAKYGGAAYVPSNGKIYFCPQTARSVMCIDTSDDSITYFDTTGTVADADTGTLTGTNKWYGIYLGADGYLYCVPYQATEVMRINPANNSITFIDTSGVVSYTAGNLSGSQKWDGGAVYGDYIYCSPSDATDFLKINTSAGTCARFGSVTAGTAKWAITAVGPNDRIYFFPYFRNDILKLNPADDSVTTLAATISSVDTNIKIGGASIMPNGRILLLPANQTQCRLLNTSDDSLSTTGKVLSFITADRFIGAALASNGAVYSVPFAGQYVLKTYYTGKEVTLPTNLILNRNGRYS